MPVLRNFRREPGQSEWPGGPGRIGTSGWHWNREREDSRWL